MSCDFYYYDHGYCCSIKRETSGDSSVNSDTYYGYCRSYSYEDCPIYKRKKDSSGGCYLTSACVEAKGLADDCRELSTLRRFRDGYLTNAEGGKAEIDEYYRIAPVIVNHIKERPNALAIFDKIYMELVLPCVEMIDAGENERAHQLYREYTMGLKALYA